MSDFISPYEISEMFQQKFDGFDFAQPYFLGEFRDNPKKGHITIGVRTPWYDFEYFVYSKASFWDGIENNKSVEDGIQRAVGHLNAAVAMHIAVSGRSTQRFDIGDINKYQSDPEGYNKGVESDNKVRTVKRAAATIYVNHDNIWTDKILVEAAEVSFLCKCIKCHQYAEHIRELRREK